MNLALRSARADGSPAHQPRDILWGNHVEEFRSRRDAHRGQIQQQVPGQAQAIVDFVRLIKIGVVEQALPSDGGARLFEKPASRCKAGEKIHRSRISTGPHSPLPPRCREWSRGRPQPSTGDPCRRNFANVGARLMNRRRRRIGDRQLLLEKHRRQHNFGPLDTKIVGRIKHSCFVRTAPAPGFAHSPNLTACRVRFTFARVWRSLRGFRPAGHEGPCRRTHPVSAGRPASSIMPADRRAPVCRASRDIDLPYRGPGSLVSDGEDALDLPIFGDHATGIQNSAQSVLQAIAIVGLFANTNVGRQAKHRSAPISAPQVCVPSSPWSPS